MLDLLYKLIDVISLPIWKDILIAIVIILGFLLFRKIFTRYISALLLKLASKTKTELDDKLVVAFKQPISTFFVFLGVYLAYRYIANDYFTVDFVMNTVMVRLFRSSIIIMLAWGFYNFTDQSSALFEQLGEKFAIDKILIPFFSKTLRFTIVVLSISIVAQEWGYDVDGFIAGLGLGGLAFALAAKDTISNIFAGIVIVMDKPFSIGDWIKTPDVEGVVEDINFRSTKVRTFAQSLVTIPNSVLVHSAITNWAKMGKRRITFRLGVTYTTPKDKLERVIKRIRTMLEEHPDIHPQTIFVTLDQFNDSSMDIFLYYFTKTTVWGEFLLIKEDTLLKIIEIMEEEGVDFAFPSTSLYMETPLKIEKGEN